MSDGLENQVFAERHQQTAQQGGNAQDVTALQSQVSELSALVQAQQSAMQQMQAQSAQVIQYLQATAQQAQNNPQPAPQQPAAPQAFSEKLPPHMREAMDPQGRFVLDEVGNHVQAQTQQAVTPILQEVQELKAQQKALLEQQRADLAARQAESQRSDINALVTKYGRDTVAKHLPSVQQQMNNFQGMSAKDAFQIVAADDILSMERKEVEAKLKADQNQMLENFGMLEGQQNDPTPEEGVTPFKSGESMMESAQAVMGSAAFNGAAVRSEMGGLS